MNNKNNNSKVVANKKKPTTGNDQIIQKRNNDASHANKMLNYIVVGTFIGAVLSGIALNTAMSKEEIVRFIAVNEEGQIVNLVALNQPNQSDEAVLKWTTRALVDTFTFSAFDINFRLNEAARRHYTRAGADSMLSAIKNSGNFDAVIEREMFVSIALEHTPLLLDHVMLNGRFFGWDIRVPAIITYRTGTQTFSNRVIIDLTVSRRSLLESSSGIGISRIVMQNAR